MNSNANSPTTFDQQDGLDVIDAIRGYAILLVILAHLTPYVVELVWPAKRVFLLGVYGVQLFFMASALTLLMSWGRMQGSFQERFRKFIIRRVFRIAPLYFLAIPLYWFIYSVPHSDFSWSKLLGTLFFINAWSPNLIPTVPGWMPVPGGWSISVEFCFYLIFPILASCVGTLKRAVAFFLISVVVMYLTSRLGMQLYPELTSEQRNNFLYFLPLNHLPIFALGFVLYFLVRRPSEYSHRMALPLHESATLGLVLITLSLMSVYGQRKFFDLSTLYPPTHLLLSMLFLIWVYHLVVNGDRLFVNRYMVALGKVSFSAYILHFLALRFSSTVLDMFWTADKGGYYSIGYAFCLLCVSLLLTYGCAVFSYRYIEVPFIRLGKSFTR